MPKQSEMEGIFESWNWHLYNHLQQADSVANRMMHEMMSCGVPMRMYIPYLQEKVKDMLEQIAEQR